MALQPGSDPHEGLMMKRQFVTTITTLLMVGATVLGVTLTIMDGRFEQVDERFEQVDARFEQMAAQVDTRFERVEGRIDRLEDRMERMENRINDQFRAMATAIGRLEGLIQGMHGPSPTEAQRSDKRDEQPPRRAPA